MKGMRDFKKAISCQGTGTLPHQTGAGKYDEYKQVNASINFQFSPDNLMAIINIARKNGIDAKPLKTIDLNIGGYLRSIKIEEGVFWGALNCTHDTYFILIDG